MHSHVLPRGFTKTRQYGILGNNRRKPTVPVAREALAHSQWLMALAIQPALPRPIQEAPECPNCGADDLSCIGRLDSSGRFTPLAAGARIRTGDPPIVRDTSRHDHGVLRNRTLRWTEEQFVFL